MSAALASFVCSEVKKMVGGDTCVHVLNVEEQPELERTSLLPEHFSYTLYVVMEGKGEVTAQY